MEQVRTAEDVRALAAMLDLLPDRVARYRRDDLRIFYVNEAQARYTGTTREDMVGRSVADYLDDAELAQLRTDLAALHPDAPVGRFLQHRNGRWTDWVEQLICGPEGDEIIAIGRDVTEHRLDRARREESETRFELVMRAAPVGMVIVDLDGRIKQVNEAFCQLCGRREQDLVGRSMVELFVPEDAAASEQLGESIARDEASPDMPLTSRFLRSDGTRFTAEAWLSLVRDAEGQPTEIVAQIVDVTAQRERERFLEQQAVMERQVSARLRELDELKDTFLAAVSHELRTPLTVLVGVAELLHAHVNDLRPAEIELLLGRQVYQAQRLGRLLADLLDLSRLTGGGAAGLQRQRADLAEVIVHVIDGGDLPSWRLACDLEPVEVDVEVAKIERVVVNLLGNALRHTPPDTPVWVRLRAQDDGVLLAVEDAGPGVPPELRERIFTPFQQGDSEAARVGGTGIGLAVVQRFVLLHGGRVWVEDRAGGGASFRVWLPADVEVAPG